MLVIHTIWLLKSVLRRIYTISKAIILSNFVFVVLHCTGSRFSPFIVDPLSEVHGMQKSEQDVIKIISLVKMAETTRCIQLPFR